MSLSIICCFWKPSSINVEVSRVHECIVNLNVVFSRKRALYVAVRSVFLGKGILISPWQCTKTLVEPWYLEEHNAGKYEYAWKRSRSQGKYCKAQESEDGKTTRHVSLQRNLCHL